MSSYIVNDKTINRVLTYLKYNPDFEIAKKHKDLEKLGRSMLKLNIEATEQRYPENPYLNTKEKKDRLKGFKFVEEPGSPTQAFKSLGCLTYQCSEGNIPNRKLYKELNKFEYDLAISIVMHSADYSMGEWG